MTKRYYIETWGCQMNDHDTEKMSGSLEAKGYEATEDAQEADVYLLNTCSIREKAQEKVFSRLGVLRKIKQAEHPEMIIGVTGCVAQQEGGKIFDRAPYVDLVMGTQALSSLPNMIDNLHQAKGRQLRTEQDPENHLYPQQKIKRASRLKALVTIMEGCNNYCSFCIVPFTRGRERCRPLQDIVDEVRMLAESGVREVELLGQNVNSYRSEVNFAGLLRKLNEIEEIDLVRYISPHPKDIDREVMQTIRDCPRIATNLHLPAQSGNSRVLRRMGRGHTREAYLEKVAMIREEVPEISLTSDFIVGFPGEREPEFEETLSLIECVGYDGLFSFMYSPRPGTGAIKHGDPVPLEDKQRRLQKLQSLQQRIQTQRMQARIGQRRRILIDGVKPSDRHPLAGRGRDNILVHVAGTFEHPERFYGRWLTVVITGAGTHTLRAEPDAGSMVV